MYYALGTAAKNGTTGKRSRLGKKLHAITLTHDNDALLFGNENKRLVSIERFPVGA